MGRKYTRFAALMLWVGMLAQAGQASETDRLLANFAGCAGRLSAEMEFQWLMSDRASDATERERAHMISLLESVAGPGDGTAILALRIETKLAHQQLLTRSAFDREPEIRLRARRLADAHLAQCRGLILGAGA